MSAALQLPADILDADLAKKTGAKAACSIRDLLIVLGISDEELGEMDEKDEILAREPWRRDSLKFVADTELQGGMRIGHMEGAIDWSGTKFEGTP